MISGCPARASTSGDQSRAARSNNSVPGAIRLVERVLAGESQPEVVLGQKDVGRPAPHLRLVVADPDELGGREAGQGVVAGHLDQPLGTDRRPDRVALGGGPLVVPQDRRPEHAIRRVEQHEPVHLAGEADRHDVRSGATGRRQ